MLRQLGCPFRCRKCWGDRRKDKRKVDGKDVVPQESCDASAFMDLILQACSTDDEKKDNDQSSTDVDATVGTETHIECLPSEEVSVTLLIIPGDDESCDVEVSLNSRQCQVDGDLNAIHLKFDDSSASCRAKTSPPESDRGSHVSLDSCNGIMIESVMHVSPEEIEGMSSSPNPDTFDRPVESKTPESMPVTLECDDGAASGSVRALDSIIDLADATAAQATAVSLEPNCSQTRAVEKVHVDHPQQPPSAIPACTSAMLTTVVPARPDACAAARLTPLSFVTILAGRASDLDLERSSCHEVCEPVVKDKLERSPDRVASIQLAPLKFEILEEESICIDSKRDEITEDPSGLSQVPIESRKLKFWNEHENDHERVRLLDSVALLGSRVPTIVLQHILDEVISDASFACFNSSDDDDDIMSMESTMSDLSDIDERVYGTPQKPQPTPTSLGRSLGGGNMNFVPSVPERDTNESPYGWGDEKSSSPGFESPPNTPHSACRSLGGGQIPMIEHSPGGDSDDDENSRLLSLDIWKYGASCAKSTWHPDAKAPTTLPSVEKVLYAACSLFLGDITEEIVPRNQTLFLQKTLHRDSEMDRKLALKALGINLQRPKELLEMAYAIGSQSPKDPFPNDDDDEHQTGEQLSLQRSISFHDKMENEGSTSRFYESSVEGDDVVVVYDSDLAFASRRNSAILSIEISGVTTSDSKTVFSFIESIFDDVAAHGGDIITFTGETVIVEWTTLNPEPVRGLGTRSFVPSTLGECALAAAMCGAKVVSYDSHVKSSASSTSHTREPTLQHRSAALYVKCALGVGEILGIHLSGHQSIREHVVIGEAIDQVFGALRCAQNGQVVSSGRGLKALGTACVLKDLCWASEFEQPCVIATGNSICWGDMTRETTTSEAGTRDLVFKAARKLPTETLKRFRRLISAYTDPRISTNDEDGFAPRLDINSCIQSPTQRQNVESRPAFVMCIIPSVAIHLSGNDYVDKRLVKLLNDVMGFTTRELLKFGGQLQKFVVEDASVVFLATFGLHDCTSPRIVADLALPAAVSIHNGLLQEFKIHNKVGLTFGDVYCGVASGANRDTSLILGASVNLAKQLMAYDDNPGILIDHAVRMLANVAYAFNALEPIEAKGYSKAVPIYEPLSPFCRSWGRVSPNFVGRTAHIIALSEKARDVFLSPTSDPSMIFLCGDSGMGKSTTMNYALEHIRRTIKPSRRQFVLAHHSCEESHVNLPFGAYTNLLISVLPSHHSWPEGRRGEDEERLSCALQMSLQTPSKCQDRLRSMYTNTIRVICSEISAPVGFADFVGQFLPWSVSQPSPPSRGDRPLIRGASLDDLVGLMVQAFNGCVRGSNLAIIALDDVHNMDELSWQVLEALFDESKNVLFLCTVKGLSPAGSTMSNSFWRRLNSDHREDGRFQVLVVGELLDENIKQLTAKIMGLRLDAIPTQFMQSIMTESKGCPAVACAILESIKRTSNNTKAGSRCLEIEANGDSFFTDVGKLLAGRIASLPFAVRTILDIGAILGTSFELFEFLDFLSFHSESNEVEEFPQDPMRALESAIEEGIMYVSQAILSDADCDSFWSVAALKAWQTSQVRLMPDSSKQLRIRCAFADSAWHAATLSLMNDSRKGELHRAVAIWLQNNALWPLSSLPCRISAFNHWKAAKCLVPATTVALSIARSFERMEMYNQCIPILRVTFETWTLDRVDALAKVGDTPQAQYFSALGQAELELLVQLLSELGRILAHAGMASECRSIYEQGLAVSSHALISDDCNPSITFPLYVEVFSAIECGLLEQDDERAFEQELVSRFVHESFSHGDPVHYSSALAMEANLFSRLGLFHEAVLVHSKLVQVYDPKQHSVSVTKAYGRDLVAQCFGHSATWYSQIDEPEAALEVCMYVKNCLLPTMARDDVRNSMMILYPVLWVLKDHGRVAEAKQMFKRYFLDAVQDCGNEGSFDVFRPLLEPIRMLLDLAEGETTELDRYHILQWALNEENLRFDIMLNCTLGHLGRCPNSISAEICLLLAKAHVNEDNALILIRTGLTLADETLTLAEERRIHVASSQIRPVYRSLREMFPVGEGCT